MPFRNKSVTFAGSKKRAFRLKIKIQKVLLWLLPVIFLVSSCSPYQRVFKHGSFQEKFDMGVHYFNEGDYFKSSSLFEQVIPAFRGTTKAEMTLYYYAMCHYEMGDFVMAAYYFENFVKTYPTSDSSAVCLFMTAKCYFLDSPVYSLDQTNTYKAIQQIELFIRKFPRSTRVEECNVLLDQLRLKLETKSFETARLYLNMEQYKSATTEFQNLLKDFPDTRYREEVLFLVVKCAYDYAANSIPAKKMERMRMAVDAFHNYEKSFPAGEYLGPAKNYFESAVKNIEKLSSIN